TDLWNNDNVQPNFYRINNKAVISTAEELYIAGVATAQELSTLLPRINNINSCPRLKDYINDIRLCQHNYITERIEKLLSRCEKIISQRNYEISFDVESDFEIMVDWHRKQLEILKDLDSELTAIEGSERYRIEEQEQLQEQAEPEQDITPAKLQRESWLWKLYEKTLKVIVDAVMERLLPK
ncbi:unnamed protein product, partial [marine sediment metagenome]